jgi:glyoxylase-like metal-dependent hydrolase (beta-lactamase superfamily II)
MTEPDRPLGAHVSLLGSPRGGKYPEGRPLLVTGSEERVVIDPSLVLIGRAGGAPPADRVLNSHCHEDHVAGNHRFPDVPWHFHALDLPGIRSLDGMMAIYGFDAATDAAFRRVVVEDFHWTARPDAVAYGHGDVFDLGGVRVRAIHAPGHTRGHCVLAIEPDGVLYLGDIDLSSFGPYYGDAWSSLDDFTRTLARVREIDARWYATFHHVGIIEGRTAFLARLDRFAAVIDDRERRLLAFLDVPRTLDEIAIHRFVYRPGDPVAYADAVERRSMSQHLARLARQGRVREAEPARWLATT